MASICIIRKRKNTICVSDDMNGIFQWLHSLVVVSIIRGNKISGWYNAEAVKEALRW